MWIKVSSANRTRFSPDPEFFVVVGSLPSGDEARLSLFPAPVVAVGSAVVVGVESAVALLSLILALEGPPSTL